MASGTHALVSGRYRGRSEQFEVELRVDVDGPRPTHRVSADYSRVADGERQGSMRVETPKVRVTASLVVITGTADFTWSTPHRRVSITIPRAASAGAPAPATLSHVQPAGRPGASYTCAFESSSFRSVVFEEAIQVGVTRFESYDTALLASAGRVQTLTVVKAFEEAGIDLQVAPTPTRLDTSAAGADGAWSDAELHAAMQQQFTRWRDRPQWAAWLLHATRHDGTGNYGDGIKGVMFDQRGAPRQGCAVFYDGIAPHGADAERLRLYTCVHELAHTFNLTHCWQTSHVRPPVPSRPNVASWMNYPERFPGGDAAFWRAFAFEFDAAELAHLRHAFADDIIMGGAALGASGASARRGASGERSRLGGDPGVRLTLGAPAVLGYGVPASIDFTLSATNRAGSIVPSVLGPRPGTVDVAVTRPDGETEVFQPLLHHCRGTQSRLLRAGEPPIRGAAFVHYGRNGYMFSEPGRYGVRARYTALDGSFVDSDVVSIRVQRPRTAADRVIGELTYRDEQVGVLLSLMGSDSIALRGGTDALMEIVDRFPGHPAAAIARLALGANAARTFKRIERAGEVEVRELDQPLARRMLNPVVDVDRFAASAARRRSAGGAIAARRGVAPSVEAYMRARANELAVALTHLHPPSSRPA